MPKDNANKSAERIGLTVGDIKAATREVTNASAEISTSTIDLSASLATAVNADQEWKEF